MKLYFVYILGSRSETIYVGVTGDLARRTLEHRLGVKEGFTKRYRIKRLLYFEETTSIHAAIAREKQIKGYRREKKDALIARMNPLWLDLFDIYGTPEQRRFAPTED